MKMEEKKTLKNKLVENVDDKVWEVFTGWYKNEQRKSQHPINKDN